MADVYATQQVGVADGTLTPASRADGREVGAAKLSTIASKPAGTALANGDRLYLGKRPAGQKISKIFLATDTSLGTSTIDIGDGTTADKYVDGATLTATDTPTAIGPKASTIDDAPSDSDEDLWATVGVADIGAAVLLSFEIEFVGIS